MGWSLAAVTLCLVAGVEGQAEEPDGGKDQGGGEAILSDPILASVDGAEIRTSALARRVVTMFQDSGMNIKVDGAEKLIEQMREQVLSQMISERLLDNAAKEAKIEAGGEEVEAMLASFKKRLPDGETYDAYLRRYGATGEMVKKDIRRNLRVKKWVESNTSDLPKPTAEQIEAIYKERPEYAITLGKAKARHILISTAGVKDEEHGKQRIREAKAIWDRLVGENPEDFEAVAREVSEDPTTAPEGGDLGEVKQGELEDDIDVVIFSQPIGVVGPAMPSRHGLHIIKVESRTETKHHTLEEATPVIRRDLIGQRHNERVFELLDQLYEKSEILVRDEETGKLVEFQG